MLLYSKSNAKCRLYKNPFKEYTRADESVVISCFSQAQELNPPDMSTLSYTQHTHNLLYIKYKKIYIKLIRAGWSGMKETHPTCLIHLPKGTVTRSNCLHTFIYVNVMNA